MMSKRIHAIQAIRWIFFDIGSTLVDEEEAYNHRIRDMIQGTSITFEQFSEKRIQYAKAGYNGDQKAIEYFALNKTPWHSEDEVPYPDAAPALEVLHRRGFKLGVIANQNLGTEQRLINWDMRQFFAFVAASAELRVAKLDPAIFEWALAQANCSPQNAVMVGDRMDNDIAPANRIGIHTVRLMRGLGAYHEPQSVDEIPEYTISALSELIDLL